MSMNRKDLIGAGCWLLLSYWAGWRPWALPNFTPSFAPCTKGAGSTGTAFGNSLGPRPIASVVAHLVAGDSEGARVADCFGGAAYSGS